MKLLLFLTFSAMASAQLAQPVRFVSANPAGACANGEAVRYNYLQNKLWGCHAGTWAEISGAGGGDVFGGASLTTAGRIAYVASSGTLAEDACVTRGTGLRLDVGCTGSTATLRVYDSTAATGKTKLIVRGGADQDTSLLDVQLADGTPVTTLLSDGTIWRLDGGAVKIQLGTEITVHSGGGVRFSNGANVFGGTVDAAINRAAAGQIEVNNGTPGTLRDLKVRTMKQPPLTVATLPGSPAAGDVVYISDSATGDCVTGGGSVFAGCRYNGSAWEAF